MWGEPTVEELKRENERLRREVATLKVRLGEHGDTCIDNPGAHAPYVVVSSVFDGGAYRVQPGQRVMFQHGSLSEVVYN